jgi:hypothetical protein
MNDWHPVTLISIELGTDAVTVTPDDAAPAPVAIALKKAQIRPAAIRARARENNGVRIRMRYVSAGQWKMVSECPAMSQRSLC